jgi:hypothetical protein
MNRPHRTDREEVRPNPQCSAQAERADLERCFVCTGFAGEKNVMFERSGKIIRAQEGMDCLFNQARGVRVIRACSRG